MRSVLRPLSAVVAATALASCMDMSAPTGRRASLAIAPRFSQSASLSSATLAQAGVAFNAVRVLIIREATPPDTLKDTTLAFTPTTPELTLDLLVNAQPTEDLKAIVQFKQDAQVLFSGTATVKAIAPTASATATPAEVLVSYVGPGSTAATVAIAPGSGLYSATTATQFTAKAFDANNIELTTAPIVWSVSDENKATISATGLLTPKNQRGSVEVTASTANGVKKTITVQLAPPSSGLRVVQGAGQKGVANAALPVPVVVELFAADGLPAAAAGQSVTFSAVTGNGSQITPASVTIDGNGRASATMTLGTVAGVTYIFKAKVGTDSVLWGASATPGTPTHFLLNTGTSLTFTAGARPDPYPTIRLADAQENAVPGRFVTVTVHKNGVLFAGPGSIPLDSIGAFEVYQAVPTIAATYTVKIEAEASLGIAPVTYTITVNPGPAARLVFSQQPPANVVSGSTITVKVTIQDAYENTVTSAAPSNVNLAIDPATSGWNISGTGSVAPVNGVAAFSVQINTTSGAKNGVKIQAVGASLPAVLSAAFNITP